MPEISGRNGELQGNSVFKSDIAGTGSDKDPEASGLNRPATMHATGVTIRSVSAPFPSPVQIAVQKKSEKQRQVLLMNTKRKQSRKKRTGTMI